jgi:hypothetical protein
LQCATPHSLPQKAHRLVLFIWVLLDGWMQEVHHTVNILPVNVESLLLLENWFLFMGLIFEFTKRKKV